MAESYGSVARPVNLGPFSRIVEVHWNTTPRNILAVAFAVRFQTYSNDDNTYLRYYNPSDYHLQLPPLFWDHRVLDVEGWGGALDTVVVEGLPPLGSPPDYFWPTPPVDHPRWGNPGGADMEILCPRIGDGESVHLPFKAGAAGIDNYDGEGTLIGPLLAFPGGPVTAHYAGRDFEYAGAIAIRKVITGTSPLIGGPGDVSNDTDFELWCLCTAVTS